MTEKVESVVPFEAQRRSMIALYSAQRRNSIRHPGPRSEEDRHLADMAFRRPTVRSTVPLALGHSLWSSCGKSLPCAKGTFQRMVQ